MMKTYTRVAQDAVSPVIAIMLMLVVTIIIAAVVSAFAGGVIKTTEQPPQIKISAVLSQSQGLKIYHEGGDDLTWQDIALYVRPNYGRNDGQSLMEAMSYEIIKANTTTYFLTYIDGSKIIIFKPGEVAYIPPKYLSATQTRPDGTVDYNSTSYGMGASSKMLGSSVDLEMIDLKKGITIATTKMKILP